MTPPCPPPTAGDLVYVVAQGWHAEIGIPVEELNGDLARIRAIFPGARTLMFGYGKKTFITAPPDTISEYFLGPVPGPAVIQIIGLSVLPPEAYPPEDTITLTLPPGGGAALSEFIWNDLIKDNAGKLHFVSRSSDPAGLFYAARSEYNLFHTCNSWVADALQATGFDISGGNVIFSGQVMSRVHDVAASQCPLF